MTEPPPTDPALAQRIKNLEMVQAIISRLAANSFQLRAWAVTLAAAIIALSVKVDHRSSAWLAFMPLAAFWALDAYYLHQERLFRALFERVRLGRNDATPFSMDTSLVRSDVSAWWRAALAGTVALFYGSVAGAVLIVALSL